MKGQGGDGMRFCIFEKTTLDSTGWKNNWGSKRQMGIGWETVSTLGSNDEDLQDKVAGGWTGVEKCVLVSSQHRNQSDLH